MLARRHGVRIGEIGGVLEAKTRQRAEQRGHAIRVDPVTGRRLGGGPCGPLLRAASRDDSAAVEAQLDARDVIRLEFEQQRIRPVLRFHVEECVQAREITFGFIVKAQEPPAALGTFAERERPERLAAGSEQGDRRLLEPEAGEAIRGAGDEPLDFRGGEVVDQPAELGKIDGQIVIGRVGPFAVGLLGQQHGLALVPEADLGGLGEGGGAEDRLAHARVLRGRPRGALQHVGQGGQDREDGDGENNGAEFHRGGQWLLKMVIQFAGEEARWRAKGTGRKRPSCEGASSAAAEIKPGAEGTNEKRSGQ